MSINEALVGIQWTLKAFASWKHETVSGNQISNGV